MADPQEPRTQMIANPAYTTLQTLRNDVVAAQDSLAQALKTPAQLMQGREAWTGPTAATRFTEEVSGRAQRLPGLVQQILAAVDDEMARTPKQLERPLNRGMLAAE